MAGVSHTIEREVREVSKKQLICFRAFIDQPEPNPLHTFKIRELLRLGIPSPVHTIMMALLTWETKPT